eukprot:CAMPEP_0174339876 /NCGR_PEP_ID=MMETSP0810-20121108/24248_1 /TAXON_ID=73025 ORGANISM="Eutreptiella gymnastica-like, Strain CCMP1594" /NCGR_SAMPLE_ID=MMETSP0810 /ASSEMBLY_ACC=CAM_ASM_000659 /LENGTH=93 /DNA_ID=CAMNT_0015460747 /DNA_START=14 /DNA_END=292 /DNA_ORIENTATION=-
MASITTSAAPPCTGVLMAARSMCFCTAADSELIWYKLRRRPMSVWEYCFACAMRIVSSCHAFTSGRAAYHLSSSSCACRTLTPQSFDSPATVF